MMLEKGGGIRNGIAADLAEIAHDNPDFTATKIYCLSVNLQFDGIFASEDIDVRGGRLIAEVGTIPADAVAQVTRMREIGFIHDNGILKLTTNNGIPADNHITPQVGARSQLCGLADNSGTADPGSIDNGIGSDKNAALTHVKRSAAHTGASGYIDKSTVPVSDNAVGHKDSIFFTQHVKRTFTGSMGPGVRFGRAWQSERFTRDAVEPFLAVGAYLVQNVDY